MQNIERKNISFKSSDGKTTISGLVYASQKVKPFCVLQISHGMCEFIQRYEEFSMYLANHGVVVCGNDHLGHGDSVLSEEELGYFTEKNGRKFVLQDIHTLNNIAHKMYPELPVVLLGHSMGSFLARKYATLWPKTIDGLIISGTGGPNPLAGAGIALADLVGKAKGEKYRSEMVNRVAFGQYLKKIENPATNYDWISRDPEIVDIYANDPNCTFIFTVNGFHELFSALKDVSSLQWAEEISKNMPIYIFSGDADPVGDYGKGVITVFTWLKEAGVEDVTMKLYSQGRHEMLNEINRDEVYRDVLGFLQEHWESEK